MSLKKLTAKKSTYDNRLTDTILKLRGNAMIYGPTGSGKSRAVLDAFKEMIKRGELDTYFKLTMSPGVEDVDLITKFVPAENGGVTKSRGLLRQAYELASRGKRVGILIDEINRATPRATNLIITAIDPVEGEYLLVDFVEGDEVRVPLENLKVMATANMGASYSGTNRLDEALLDRFQHTIYWGYDNGLEEKIVGEDHSWVLDLAQALRNEYREGNLRSPLSTRHIAGYIEELLAVKNVTSGTVIKAAMNTFVYRLVGVDPYGFPNREELDLVKNHIAKAFREREKGGE